MMDNDYLHNEQSHPLQRLSGILKSPLLWTAVALFGAGAVADNQLDGLHVVDIQVSDNLEAIIPGAHGTVLGPGADTAAMKGITKRAAVYVREIPDKFTTLQAADIPPGRHIIPNASRIVGHLHDVDIIAEERLIVDGDCTNCNIDVFRVPVGGGQTFTGIAPATGQTVIGTTGGHLLFGNQPSLIVTGAATNSTLSSMGDVYVGENRGSRLRSLNDTLVGAEGSRLSASGVEVPSGGNVTNYYGDVYTSNSTVTVESDSIETTIDENGVHTTVNGKPVKPSQNGITIQSGSRSTVIIHSGP